MYRINDIYLEDVICGLKELDDESADIIIVDPPYNIGKDFGNTKYELKIEEYVNWVGEWYVECRRILKESGTLYIYGFSEILAHISVNVDLPHRWLIWHYTNKTVPRLNFWQRSHESIIIAWKDKEKRIFNKDAVREPYTPVFLKNAAGRTRTNTKGRFSKGDKETIYTAHDLGALPRDVMKVSALAGGAGRRERWFYCKDCENTFFNKFAKDHIDHNIVKHPTQKPMELTRRLMLAAKPNLGGFVVIPFCGSGSEALVATQVGLDFIGFDVNEDYVNMAKCLLGENDGS